MRCANDPALFDFEVNSTREFIQSLTKFQRFYSPIHGRICVVLCTFGVLTNLIHCIVLTRATMRRSAVNCLMTAVALCDMGTMSSYLIYILHFVLLNSPDSCSNTLTYGWMVFLLVHMSISITLHTTTLWLAVAMAMTRRMTLRAATLNSHWQKAQLAKRITLITLAVVILLSVPTLMVHQIIEYQHERWLPPAGRRCHYPDNYTETIYTIVIAESALANGCIIFKSNLWLTGILFKFIPCILLIYLTSSLMLRLRNAEKKRQRALLDEGLMSANDTNKRITSDRTTALLVSILVVFVLTELPQGILAVLNAIYTTDVHRFIYLTLGDILDLLSLLNSSVNFVLYCLMSSRYRQTFLGLVFSLSKRAGFLAIGPSVKEESRNENPLFLLRSENRIRSQASPSAIEIHRPKESTIMECTKLAVQIDDEEDERVAMPEERVSHGVKLSAFSEPATLEDKDDDDDDDGRREDS